MLLGKEHSPILNIPRHRLVLGGIWSLISLGCDKSCQSCPWSIKICIKPQLCRARAQILPTRFLLTGVVRRSRLIVIFFPWSWFIKICIETPLWFADAFRWLNRARESKSPPHWCFDLIVIDLSGGGQNLWPLNIPQSWCMVDRTSFLLSVWICIAVGRRTIGTWTKTRGLLHGGECSAINYCV
jgi:hypothetical protein